MIAIVDVHYEGDCARAARIDAEKWSSAVPANERVVVLSGIAPYVPGKFYLRELPCLLEVLRGGAFECVVIDAYVWLGSKKGLGAHLFDAIATPVVGVAKTAFHGARAEKVIRGKSARPLFVTAAGLDAKHAAELVDSMHGEHRIPTLVRLADELSRG